MKLKKPLKSYQTCFAFLPARISNNEIVWMQKYYEQITLSPFTHRTDNLEDAEKGLFNKL